MPQLNFLCKTKLKTVHMNNVRKNLKIDNCFAVSSKENNGGLTIL